MMRVGSSGSGSGSHVHDDTVADDDALDEDANDMIPFPHPIVMIRRYIYVMYFFKFYGLDDV